MGLAPETGGRFAGASTSSGVPLGVIHFCIADMKALTRTSAVPRAGTYRVQHWYLCYCGLAGEDCATQSSQPNPGLHQFNPWRHNSLHLDKTPFFCAYRTMNSGFKEKNPRAPLRQVGTKAWGRTPQISGSSETMHHTWAVVSRSAHPKTPYRRRVRRAACDDEGVETIFVSSTSDCIHSAYVDVWSAAMLRFDPSIIGRVTWPDQRVNEQQF